MTTTLFARSLPIRPRGSKLCTTDTVASLIRSLCASSATGALPRTSCRSRSSPYGGADPRSRPAVARSAHGSARSSATARSIVFAAIATGPGSTRPIEGESIEPAVSDPWAAVALELSGEEVRKALAELPDRAAADDRARLLRRLLAVRDRHRHVEVPLGTVEGTGSDRPRQVARQPRRPHGDAVADAMSHDEIADLLALDAVGVLEPSERDAMERHLGHLRALPGDGGAVRRRRRDAADGARARAAARSPPSQPHGPGLRRGEPAPPIAVVATASSTPSPRIGRSPLSEPPPSWLPSSSGSGAPPAGATSRRRSPILHGVRYDGDRNARRQQHRRRGRADGEGPQIRSPPPRSTRCG